MFGAASRPPGRLVTCRIANALGEPLSVRFPRSRCSQSEPTGGVATYIAVLAGEPARSAASPLERIALLLIEAEHLAGGLRNGLLAKLIRAVLLQVGFDAGDDLKAAAAPADGSARH